jgi:hypothetical protein
MNLNPKKIFGPKFEIKFLSTVPQQQELKLPVLYLICHCRCFIILITGTGTTFITAQY